MFPLSSLTPPRMVDTRSQQCAERGVAWLARSFGERCSNWLRDSEKVAHRTFSLLQCRLDLQSQREPRARSGASTDVLLVRGASLDLLGVIPRRTNRIILVNLVAPGIAYQTFLQPEKTLQVHLRGNKPSSLYRGRTINNGSLVAVSTRSVMLPNIRFWTDPCP